MRERRASGMAAVLFTDLVGSTDLMTRVGEGAYDELRRAHFAALRHAVERAGGDEVKNTGDGVMATFGSVVDAIGGAVAMQQATEGQARSAGAPLSIRVGVSLGEVTFEDGDVFGSPVVEAARLVAAARPGQILTTVIARALAVGRSEFGFTDLGPMDLKGLPEPVAVCEVVWEPLQQSTVSLPTFQTDTGRIFVGRHDELGRLEQLWKEVVAGERRAALLGGEPGIGKTRLALEVARGAHGEGAVVLAGRCDEDLGVPYQPFVEALRHFVQATPGPELAGRLGRHPGELVRLVPEIAEAVPGLPPAMRSDPETERYRLFDAVASWLAAVSAEAPVLLVLDDLHWAAKPTLLLLRHVLRFAEPLRLLVVATYRDTELGRRHPLADLLADLRRQPGVERISVSGLDAAGVTAFIEQVAGHHLEDDDEAFTRAIYTETEGNPFFVSEVLRHLVESGGVERRHGRWVPTGPVDELGIPEGIRDVVSRRLSRLSDEANDVLAVAAALGLDFEPALLQQAGGLSEDTVLATLEEAVSARLVRDVPGPVPSYRFSHALVRGTLYDELSAARRVAVHRKLAEAIEIVHARRLDEHLPALAYHYAQASVPAAEPDKAVEYARRAGAAALAQLAHDDAVRYYRQALELLDAHGAPAGDPRRVDVLIALGEGQRRSGDPASRETLFEAARRARERGDSDALARAALANSRGSLAGDAGRLDTELLAVLEGALEATGESDSAARARLMAHIALEKVWAGDREELVRLDEGALAMARRLDDPAVLADVLLSGFYAIHSPSTMTERLERAADVLALAEQLGDGRMMLHAYWHGARAAMEGGDIAEARRCVQHQERLAADLGEPTLRWMAAVSGVGLPLAAGQVAEADARNEAALAMGQGTQPDAPTFYAAQLFPIRYTQGRLAEVEEMFRALVEDPGFPVPAAEALTALIYCDTDRLEEARRFYEPLAATGFSRLRFDSLWVIGLCACAEVCVGLGDTGSAGVLRRLLLPFSDHLATILTSGSNSVSHYLGMLEGCAGHYDDAETWFATAVAGHDRLGTPAWLARTRLEWACMLLTRREAGDVQRAEELLGPALATARELGLGRVERRAAALLADLG